MNEKAPTPPPGQKIMEIISGYNKACVVGAACELDVFSHIDAAGISAIKLAENLAVDERGLTCLLDALCALGYPHDHPSDAHHAPLVRAFARCEKWQTLEEG